jgi:hypothetical protein
LELPNVGFDGFRKLCQLFTNGASKQLHIGNVAKSTCLPSWKKLKLIKIIVTQCGNSPYSVDWLSNQEEEEWTPHR